MWLIIFLIFAYVVLFGNIPEMGAGLLYLILAIILYIFIRCLFSHRIKNNPKSKEEMEADIEYDNDNYLTQDRIEKR